jgi:hypothetical protein
VIAKDTSAKGKRRDHARRSHDPNRQRPDPHRLH